MPQYSIRIECCFWFYKLTSTEKKLEQITGDIIIFIDTCVKGGGGMENEIHVYIQFDEK